MFKMSKEELVARLSVVTSADFSKFLTDDVQERKLILLTPAGLITCRSAKISDTEEVIETAGETKTLNLLEMALSAKMPDDSQAGVEERTFLYCVDATITPYSGGTINVPGICIALESVFGFSLGYKE